MAHADSRSHCQNHTFLFLFLSETFELPVFTISNFSSSRLFSFVDYTSLTIAVSLESINRRHFVVVVSSKARGKIRLPKMQLSRNRILSHNSRIRLSSEPVRSALDCFSHICKMPALGYVKYACCFQP